jgi:t-SNARE complex subunit (syntaxin)
VEQVNARTLQSTMKDYVEEHGDLSDELKKVIRSYDTYDIARRKETNKATKGGKAK